MLQELFYFCIFLIQLLTAISNVETFEGTSKFAICSGHVMRGRYNQEHQALQQRVLANHKTYAQMNNYTYVHYNKQLDMSRESEGLKISIMRTLLKDKNNFEWLLWIDSDAIFVDMNRKIETILSEYRVSEGKSLLFSGDSNAINTGLMLVKNNQWIRDSLKEISDIGDTFSNHPQIGMGFDNCAFSMYLAGCKSNNTIDELQSCYLKSDLGHIHPEFKNEIQQANFTVYQMILAPEIAVHARPIPANAWNCYDKSSASFVVHYPGRPPGVKARVVRDALSRVKNDPNNVPISDT